MHTIDYYEALIEVSKEKFKSTMKERKGDNLNKFIENLYDHLYPQHFKKNPDPLKAITLLKAKLDDIEKFLKERETVNLKSILKKCKKGFIPEKELKGILSEEEFSFLIKEMDKGIRVKGIRWVSWVAGKNLGTRALWIVREDDEQ